MDTMRTARLGASALIAGAIVQGGCGIAQVSEPLVSGQAGFGLRNTLVAIAQLLLMTGLIGLWREGATGGSRLGRIGLAAAVGASGLLVVAELVDLYLTAAAAEPIYGVATPLLGVGMVLVGVAALKARRWTSWRRFAPLICGLYVLVVLLPAFAISGGPNFLALTVFNVCWLALGVALWASAVLPPSGMTRQAGGTGGTEAGIHG